MATDAPTPPFPVALAIEAAHNLGWSTRLLDPEFGYLWEVALPDGRRRVMVGVKTPVNDGAASQLATDKHYTSMVLAEQGVRVPAGVRALSPRHFRGTELAGCANLDEARTFADRTGYPLIVKPNRLSHGRLVRCVEDAAALEAAVAAIWELDRVALVQERVVGRELRIDLLDGELLAAYERHPQRLVGDGRRSLAELLVAADSRFAEPLAMGRAIADGLDAERVPDAGEMVELGDGVHNLNRSASASLIPELPEPWRAWAARVAAHLGLRLAGIDLRIDCDREPLEADPERAVVLEVNGTPLLAQMAKLGHHELAVRAQARILAAWA